jgi:hypothetical protein
VLGSDRQLPYAQALEASLQSLSEGGAQLLAVIDVAVTQLGVARGL